MTKWCIIGCGYTGAFLASRLLDSGAEVVLTGRASQPAEALAALIDRGARYHAFDLDASPPLIDWLPKAAHIVVTSPPARGAGAAGVRERAFVAALSDVARVVYLSSTGVYPRGQGEPMDETTPVAPAAGHGIARLSAETAVLETAAEHGISAVSLRVAGIYGPGRGVIERMRAGTYRIIGDGSGYVSRVHVHDLVSAIVAAATIAPLPHTTVNVADDSPCPSLEYAQHVAKRLGVEDPPIVAIDKVDARVAALVGSNRQIDNSRLKTDFAVTLRYPSWRDSVDELTGATR